MAESAIFLDRDGTIIEDVGYVRSPEDVRLMPGAAEAIRRFSKLGHRVVVISNQSGVARGILDEEELAAVHERMEELLEAQDASLDGAFYCPYLDGPAAKVEAFRRDSDLRKPNPGMLHQAAEELDLDLARSWMMGDSARDVEAGTRAGCRTVRLAAGDADGDDDQAATIKVASLLEAAYFLEREMKRDSGEVSHRTSPEKDDEGVVLLRRICTQVERMERARRQQDFSLFRLLASLFQMFALVTALWAAAAIFNDESAAATARFAMACFLQLLSISTFALDRFR